MAVTIKTKDDLVSGQVAAAQSQAAGLVDASEGSILLALSQAFADVVAWIQGMILTLLATTRAATSVGSDLDSWMADFNFPRLPGSTAAGHETFSRVSAGTQALIPVGATTETADGSQTFVVTVDATNPALNISMNAYVMDVGTYSVTVPASDTAVGAAGNVAAGAVNTITSAIPGVDTVSNADPFAGGGDAELDPAYRTRFALYLSSLSKATPQAILAAVRALGRTVTDVIVEGQSYAGVAQDASFYVVVDDGSGDPSDGFLAQASAAIDATRAAGISFTVYGPNEIIANVTMTLAIDVTYDRATVCGLAQMAVAANINGLGQGVSLDYLRLAQVAYDASPGITKVTALRVNGGTSDITATLKDSIKAGSVIATPA